MTLERAARSSLPGAVPSLSLLPNLSPKVAPSLPPLLAPLRDRTTGIKKAIRASHVAVRGFACVRAHLLQATPRLILGISGNQHKNCIVFSIKWYNKSSIPPFPVSPPSETETLRCNQAGEEVFTFMHTLKIELRKSGIRFKISTQGEADAPILGALTTSILLCLIWWSACRGGGRGASMIGADSMNLI